LYGDHRYTQDVTFHQVWARLLTLLDNDSVRPFVPMYYVPWLTWAILATFWFPPVSVLETGMGHSVYVLWVWLTIPFTLAPMIGLLMRHGGTTYDEIKTPLLLSDWMGLFMQAAGHACMSVLLFLFEYAAVKGALEIMSTDPETAGLILFVAFVLSSYVLGTALLSMQCLRKVHKGEQLRRS
jgi:hypothetical protein